MYGQLSSRETYHGDITVSEDSVIIKCSESETYQDPSGLQQTKTMHLSSTRGNTHGVLRRSTVMHSVAFGASSNRMLRP